MHIAGRGLRIEDRVDVVVDRRRRQLREQLVDPRHEQIGIAAQGTRVTGCVSRVAIGLPETK